MPISSSFSPRTLVKQHITDVCIFKKSITCKICIHVNVNSFINLGKQNSFFSEALWKFRFGNVYKITFLGHQSHLF